VIELAFILPPNQASDNKMIELINLEKFYDTPQGPIPALQNINLSIKEGEIFGVIGKSGAGKSSLIRCLNLLEQPTSGTVRVNGCDLTALTQTQLRAARQQIGMIFQQFNLLSSQTVYNNVALPLKLQGMSRASIREIVVPLLKLVGLTDKQDYYPNKLSGGEKQRVAIARALVNKPKVLLSDEATSALDPQNTLAILRLLQDINQQLGLTIVLITHEIEVIKSICDRLAVLDQGKIIKECAVIDFFSQYHNEPGMEFLQTYLKKELPDALRQKLLPTGNTESNPVLRLFFHGAMVTKPLVSHVIQEVGLNLNILHANIEHIQHQVLGIMVVEVLSNHQQLTQAISYLQQHELTVEVIGYVPRNAISRT
jgi:D-methionine transport system ATP-binding protein